jgi:hypothetical protein
MALFLKLLKQDGKIPAGMTIANGLSEWQGKQWSAFKADQPEAHQKLQEHAKNLKDTFTKEQAAIALTLSETNNDQEIKAAAQHIRSTTEPIPPLHQKKKVKAVACMPDCDDNGVEYFDADDMLEPLPVYDSMCDNEQKQVPQELQSNKEPKVRAPSKVKALKEPKETKQMKDRITASNIVTTKTTADYVVYMTDHFAEFEVDKNSNEDFILFRRKE